MAVANVYQSTEGTVVLVTLVRPSKRLCRSWATPKRLRKGRPAEGITLIEVRVLPDEAGTVVLESGE